MKRTRNPNRVKHKRFGENQKEGEFVEHGKAPSWMIEGSASDPHDGYETSNGKRYAAAGTSIWIMKKDLMCGTCGGLGWVGANPRIATEHAPSRDCPDCDGQGIQNPAPPQTCAWCKNTGGPKPDCRGCNGRGITKNPKL